MISVIENILNINQNHLTYDDQVRLTDMVGDAQIYDIWPHGFIVYVDKFEQYPLLSNGFQKIYQMALDQQCKWIKFSTEVSPIKEFQLFRW